jgi:hypothetical protein
MPAHRELFCDATPIRTPGHDEGLPREVDQRSTSRSVLHTPGHDEGLTPGAALAPARRAQAALPLATVGAGMLVRRVSVRPPDVVFVKGLVEASEGLAGVFAERGGELLLAAPHEREAELVELLADLEAELGARIPPAPEQ